MTDRRRLTLVLLLALSAAAGGGAPAGAEPASGPPGAAAPAPSDSALESRLLQERRAEESRFSILPHRPNYLLPLAWNRSPDAGTFAASGAGGRPDRAEVKFQISLKTPLWDNVLGSRGTLYAAYSQLSFWQAYNGAESSPFRETNYEPELFLAFRTGKEFAGWASRLAAVGIDHQSNGRSGPLSRSWNRVVAVLLFSRGDWYVTVRPWWRIPERASEDDNPGMERFYGYGELLVLRKLGEHTATAMFRNNLRASGNKGAVQADWSFPLHRKIRGYVQYFNGYGESLVDYAHSANRIGIGVLVADWL